MVNSQELNKTISELETQVQKFKSISDVYAELITLKSDLIKFGEQNSSSSEKLKNVIEKLDNKLTTYENLFLELTKNNKNFQKELEQQIASKLEKHKSDIQVEIRNEGTQIQRGFENSLTLNFNNLQSKVQENIFKQEKQINSLKIQIYIVIFLCLGLGTIIFLK